MTKLTMYAIFCNRLVGEKVKANDLEDLIENRLTKRLREHWSEIKFKDNNSNTIVIRREFLYEQGMTFRDIIQDYLYYASEYDLSEEIFTI